MLVRARFSKCDGEPQRSSAGADVNDRLLMNLFRAGLGRATPGLTAGRTGHDLAAQLYRKFRSKTNRNSFTAFTTSTEGRRAFEPSHNFNLRECEPVSSLHRSSMSIARLGPLCTEGVSVQLLCFGPAMFVFLGQAPDVLFTAARGLTLTSMYCCSADGQISVIGQRAPAMQPCSVLLCFPCSIP